MSQSPTAVHVRYIGASEVPMFYWLCPNVDGAWDAAALDRHGRVTRRVGLCARQGQAIHAAEHYLDRVGRGATKGEPDQAEQRQSSWSLVPSGSLTPQPGQLGCGCLMQR